MNFTISILIQVDYFRALRHSPQEERHERVHKLFMTNPRLRSDREGSPPRVTFHSSEGLPRCFRGRKRGREGHNGDHDQVE
jgi:hypothetical protein